MSDRPEPRAGYPLSVLFVAMAESVHTVRWISQLDRRWDVHLFPVSENGLHDELAGVTTYRLVRQPRPPSAPPIRQCGVPWPLARGFMRATRLLERLPTPLVDRAHRLARLISVLKPDVVHSLEMQHAGYLTLAARELLPSGAFPPWIYSSWGSDIFFFGRDPVHAARIRAVLRACDYLITDCRRDVALARDFEFAGETLGVFPGPGGFDLERMRRRRQTGPVSGRRAVVVKGAHDEAWVGRGLTAVAALRHVAPQLAGYELVFYSAGENVRRAIDDLASETGLSCTILPYSAPDVILDALGRARFAISLNISDGTSNAMLEAMIMGALPIQSDTGSTGEWIRDGENGLVVPAEDPSAVATAIRRALADDELVNAAAARNAELMRETVDCGVVLPEVNRLYEEVAHRPGACSTRDAPAAATAEARELR